MTLPKGRIEFIVSGTFMFDNLRIRTVKDLHFSVMVSMGEFVI